MERKRIQSYKTYREKIKDFFSIKEIFSYCIYGAGENCSFVTDLMKEMYPKANLVCIFDKYKRGKKRGVEIIAPESSEKEFSYAIITTRRGLQEAKDFFKQYKGKSIPSVVCCSQQLS